jgi:uncharacterized repeat protein (TIGR03803 family)
MKSKIFNQLFCTLPQRRNRSSVGQWKTFQLILAFSAATAVTSPSQTFNTLFSFNGTDGSLPNELVQARNGKFYGTTYGGGANGGGTVFAITPEGKLTRLQNFGFSDSPTDGLVQASDGNFYGTTLVGGAYGYGSIFEITPAGRLNTLYNFCVNCADGGIPNGLVQGSNGNFYGTTSSGGADDGGTVFEITPAGKLTLLYTFCSRTNCTDGGTPSVLAQGTSGNFYGTTFSGGADGNGTVFEITPTGKLTTLHSFRGPDGNSPNGLVQGSNGNFYGTTTYGGAHGDGTVFEITTAGKLITLHSFDGTDGALPIAGQNSAAADLVQATDGNFYGTTSQGGASNLGALGGTVFRITPAGKLTTLHSFCSETNCTDGTTPYAGLMQATNGNLYGTTNNGGSYDQGTIFSLGLGLRPFVVTQPYSGKEGAKVIILGTDLAGATAVTFDGTVATFTVVSSSEIATTVPAGAKTGPVEVTTPNGTLKSNVIFRVTPQITSFTPRGGVVGASVKITGTGLTQTTEVTFGGAKGENLTVKSDSELTADVPTNATTGTIGVTTRGGTATSTGNFTVD